MDVDAMLQESRKVVPDLIALYAFGSQVSGGVRPESDVDLAVLAPKALSPSVLFTLREDLAARLNRDVDLVDLRATSTVLRMQVLSTGRCLFSGDDRARETFEMVAYASYARLNEERRGILEDIRAQGSVYAR